MNKKSTVNRLAVLLAVVALLGYGAAIASMLSTLRSGGYLCQNVCIKSECVKEWFDHVEYSLLIAKSTSDFLVALATVGGIIVALLSYFSGVSNSALSNHIAHYTTFQSYVDAEIGKRNRISRSSVDTFCWYNSIFSSSKAGNMEVSKVYLDYSVGLGNFIVSSNALVSNAGAATFRFKPHQEEMIKKLRGIGIEISMQPRLEFYEIEDQVISLISCVHQAFCFSSAIEKFERRIYL